MSTIASFGSRSVVAGVLRTIRSVSITVPATPKARAATLVEARRMYGFDLDDEVRAERILARHRR